jgi:hypothetical protein
MCVVCGISGALVVVVGTVGFRGKIRNGRGRNRRRKRRRRRRRRRRILGHTSSWAMCRNVPWLRPLFC